MAGLQDIFEIIRKKLISGNLSFANHDLLEKRCRVVCLKEVPKYKKVGAKWGHSISSSMPFEEILGLLENLEK